MQGALWDACCKCYNIGLQLGMAVDKLDVIRDRNLKNADECFTELLAEWLRQGNPQTTWRSIVATLRSKAVDMPQVASLVESVYLCNSEEKWHSAEDEITSKNGADCVPAFSVAKVVSYQHIKEFHVLNDCQKEQLEQRLIMESKDIQLKFYLLFNHFFNSIQAQNVPIKGLLTT